MTDFPRRKFLLGGIGAAAAAALPDPIARALAIPADVRSGTLMDVDHVVILMQENRSFDHYFGTLRGVRGFADPFPIPVAGDVGRTVWTQSAGDTPGRPPAIAPFHLATHENFEVMRLKGTPHTWPDAQHAWDHGRIGRWPEAKTERAMGYFTRADIPFQFALAEAFTLCDAYHCSMQAGTNPNRLYLWTGTNGGSGHQGGPAMANSHDNFVENGGAADSYSWTTYVERLQKAGIDWRLYQYMADNYTNNPLVGFAAFRAAFAGAPGSDPALKERAMTTCGLDRLREDVRTGALPQISYIIATAAGSEHPEASSPAQGAAYTAEVLDALTSNPALWSRTAPFIMFDENDGFFDHVPPPAPPSPDGAGFAGGSTVDTIGEYHQMPSPSEAMFDPEALRGRPYGLGPRVPCYVVSPWSKGGWVNSQVFDHTSVIRFLEARFGVAEPNISPWRRAVCGDLTSAFDFSSPNGAPAAIPDPRPDAARAAAIKGQVVPLAPTAATERRQEPGSRKRRPLPYDLDVAESDHVAPGQITLEFRVMGGPGAVFHVYDRRALDAIPRRYTITQGKALTGRWTRTEGYDLWVLGPDGFHRHFVGGGGQEPAVRWQFDRNAMMLTISAEIPGIIVTPNAAPDQYRPWRAAAPGSHVWSLAKTDGLYDFTISSDADPAFVRRLAGRLEFPKRPDQAPARRDRLRSRLPTIQSISST